MHKPTVQACFHFQCKNQRTFRALAFDNIMRCQQKILSCVKPREPGPCGDGSNVVLLQSICCPFCTRLVVNPIRAQRVRVAIYHWPLTSPEVMARSGDKPSSSNLHWKRRPLSLWALVLEATTQSPVWDKRNARQMHPV